jgi:hypothetical protein
MSPLLYPPRPIAGGRPGCALFRRLIREGWVIQPKHNGTRVLVRPAAGLVVTRRLLPPGTRVVPRDLHAALLALPTFGADLVYDCEVVHYRGDAMAYVFDLAAAPGFAPLAATPIEDRLLVLRNVVSGAGGAVRVTSRLGADSGLPWHWPAYTGMEGWVMKRPGSPYRWATSPDAEDPSWVKFRLPAGYVPPGDRHPPESIRGWPWDDGEDEDPDELNHRDAGHPRLPPLPR